MEETIRIRDKDQEGMNMDNRRRNPSHYNNRHRKRRKRKISPLEYPSMLVKWMIKNKAMSAVLGVLLAV